MKLKRMITLASVVVCGALLMSAAKPQKKKAEPKTDTARELYMAGKYADALPLLKKQLEKDKKSGSVNEMVAVSLYKTGNEPEAKKYFRQAASRGVNEAYYYLALYSYKDYDFAGVDRNLGELDEGKLSEKAQKEIARIHRAKEMFDHVEKIVVVDTLIVAKKDFFKSYKLSAGAGRLCSASELPFAVSDSVVAGSAFVTGNGKYALWAEADENGEMKLRENSRLLSGEWDVPVRLDEMINGDGDVCYPYMMPDGMTLYYSSNGGNSIGGYDIFVSRKDEETGNFMMPQNVGLPYNSPADDYLLVRDEQTGLGWWASERQGVKDSVTVYVFIPNTLRENYSPDEPNLDILAKVSDITHTWPADFDQDSVLERLTKLNAAKEDQGGSIMFELKPGVTYERVDDAKTENGKRMLKEYVAEKAKQDNDEEKLKALRASYAVAGETERRAMSSVLLQLENQVEKRRVTLAELANRVRQAESK